MNTVEILNNLTYGMNVLCNIIFKVHSVKKIVNMSLRMHLRGKSDARAKGGECGGKEKLLALALESPYLLLLLSRLQNCRDLRPRDSRKDRL